MLFPVVTPIAWTSTPSRVGRKVSKPPRGSIESNRNETPFVLERGDPRATPLRENSVRFVRYPVTRDALNNFFLLAFTRAGLKPTKNDRGGVFKNLVLENSDGS